MKRTKQLISITSILFFFNVVLLFSQDQYNPDKVYLHLDRNLYSQGDTMWVKGYVFERGNHILSDNSYAIHVQMLTSDGRPVRNYKLLAVDGKALGQIPILPMMTPGFYQLIAHTSYMKNFDQRFFFKTTIEVREKKRQRTVSTFFDKPTYSIGDTAKVTFSVLDQDEMPVENARFTYSYSYNNKVIEKKGLRCNDDGTVSVDLPINKGAYASPPKIKLSYYVDEGAPNPRTQDVYVPIHNTEVNVDFYPEGGDLISGVQNRVAFMATDVQGSFLDIEGELYENGEKLFDLSTQHEGKGLLSISPKKKGHYTFKITKPEGVDSIFTLPEVLSKGYSMAYLSQSEEKVCFIVSHTYKDKRHCKLWVSQCDSLWVVYDYEASSGQRVSIPKANIPKGIVTFTLSDYENVPYAERLVYVENVEPKLETGLQENTYTQREKVNLSFSVDSSLQASLSYVVVDSILSTSPHLNISNIKAYAEFETELSGRIHNVNQYIGDSKSIGVKRDLLLMTHGWRRYSWVINQMRYQTKNMYDFNAIYGKVERLGQPYPYANINALMKGTSMASADIEVDKSGRFALTPTYDEAISQDLLITAKNKKRKNGILELSIVNTDTLLFSRIIENNKDNLTPLVYSHHRTIKKASAEIAVVEEPFMIYDTKILQEIEVTAKRQEWNTSEYFKVAKETIVGMDLDETSSFSWMLEQVSNRIVEVWILKLDGGKIKEVEPSEVRDPDLIPEMTDRFKVMTSFREQEMLKPHLGLDLIFDEQNTPGYLIYVNDEPWGYDIDELDQLTSKDISGIAILDGDQGLRLFGAEAYYGAVMVYTYSPEVIASIRMKRNHATFGNFVRMREFPQVDYADYKQNTSVGYDNRVTLQWEPMLETNEEGYVKESFYTGDLAGKKLIIVQGIDEEGNLYYQKKSFVVKDVLAY